MIVSKVNLRVKSCYDLGIVNKIGYDNGYDH